MRNTALILSTIILTTAFISPRSSYALLGRLFADARKSLESVLLYTWVGLYSSIAWFSVVTGQFWILDTLGGRWGQLCGNKFMKCRPWD
jgi:hypothetical protein